MPTEPEKIVEEITLPNEEVIVPTPEVIEPVIEPVLSPEPVPSPVEVVPSNLDGFTSCFRCGREEIGNVKLSIIGSEKLCNNCRLG